MTTLHIASTRDPYMLYRLQYLIADPFYLLEVAGKKYVFLSMLDIDAFRAAHEGDVEAVDVGPLRREASKRPGNSIVNLGILIIETYAPGEVLIIPDNFPVIVADGLRAAGISLKVNDNFCPERQVKSLLEIENIRENFKHTTKAYTLIEAVLKEAVIDNNTLLYNGELLTSEWLKREVAKLFLEADLVNTEGIIIAGGRQAAEPHNLGSGPLRPHETIVVDIFPQSTKNHYFADMTRTYVKGDVSDEIAALYAAVAEAQASALAVLQPGLSYQEAYEESAEVIREHGFDVGDIGYIHSLGHGLGVELHEAPTLGPNSEGVLQIGEVVTIEPGLYYPDLGGVRIEDTVVITEDGYENLTNHPQHWHIS